jgi:ferredoxin-NADP reductase
MRGRHLSSLHARGGQFFQWRFLTRHWWWQAHPYSMSAAPRSDMMRVTVKDLGDQSGSLLSQLRPGTRVAIEGPYGVFTATARHADVVTAFAAGVGITPIRALLDDLPVSAHVTLLYRVRDMSDVPLRKELEALAFASGWTLWYLPGPREAHPMTVSYLTRFAPELPDSDVYVCGPDAFTNEVLEVARSAGIPERRLHHESFAF